MKIFLISKNALLVYSVLIIFAIAIMVASSGGSIGVFNQAQDRLLPIYSVDRGEEKICSLTFDAAWDDADTDKLIEILDKYNVKATFFIVGSWVEKYPQSVKKFYDKGHEIANHSDTHPHINNLSEQMITEEIKKCDDKIQALTGVRPNLFRGPYGEYNNTVIKAAESVGHKVIQWNIDSLDWQELSAEEITTRVLKRMSPGSIMLFHNGAKNTPAALPVILDKLTADGYKIVPASELIYHDSYTIDHMGRQIK